MLVLQVRTVVGAAYRSVFADAFGQDAVEVTIRHSRNGHFDTVYHNGTRSAVGFVPVFVSFNRGVKYEMAVATWVTIVHALLLESFKGHRTVLAEERHGGGT